ncbi:MAG: WYL domain-containing protein [Oscillospiraceae bacterium]|nr:WYL domain-containing protein [Oscillospiraceae bacterium]
MAYSELIKNFNRIRDYMREFYVYGFKSREEYTGKSARSYDDERRRLESWLGDYMHFRQTAEGKNVFISIDSRLSRHNPLFKAWKTKSFTDGDITLHFILFDILSDSESALNISEITGEIDRRLACFSEPRVFDESTLRKKLKEYVSQGLIVSEKKGKVMYYRRSEAAPSLNRDALDYFSEVLPCGVIGSYLLDKGEVRKSCFAFKHHYITGAMDSEVLYSVFTAIREKRSITMETVNRHKDRITENHVIPLKLMVSAQSGRQYLMAYTPRFNRITAFRTDNIISAGPDDVCESYDEFHRKFEEMLPHMWGVCTEKRPGRSLQHVEFTIRYSDEEKHIPGRLEREKRCGTVEHSDNNTSRFFADVYDAGELIPWIRSFICRITDIHFSDSALEERFKKDIEDMYALYGLGGEEQ